VTDPAKTAVVLLAHGSPDSVDEIPAFLLEVTGGRPLPQNVIDEVKHRYGLIGQSPLTRWTLLQRDLLRERIQLPVYVGMRNWKPFIRDTVREIEKDGIERVVAICLAPQNSRTSVGLYRKTLAGENGTPFAIDFVESWHDHPLLIKAFAEKFASGMRRATEKLGRKPPVIFTAHSVPERTITEGDPYEAQAKETAALVAKCAGLADSDWRFAFQSQGMSGGTWLGPTVEDTILAWKQQGHDAVFIQPIGFLCDHVEVLYDIDIGFRQFCEKENMRLFRAESLNDSPLLADSLADIAQSRLATLARKPA